MIPRPSRRRGRRGHQDAFDAYVAQVERLQGYEADFLADEDYEWADAYRREYRTQFITGSGGGAGGVVRTRLRRRVSRCGTSPRRPG